MTTTEEQVEVLDGEIVEETSTELVVPHTGELLDLSQLPTEQLAKVLDDAREWQRAQWDAFKREVQEEVLRRADRAVASGESDSWTLRVDGYKLECDTPDRFDYEVETLRPVLQQLADAELIESGVCSECGAATGQLGKVIVPSGWKVAKRPLQNLLRLGGVVKDSIESCRVPVTRPRSVRVSQEGR